MVWRFVPRQLVAVAMGSVLLGGCTSAVLQTPTLSYWDPSGAPVLHPKERTAGGRKTGSYKDAKGDAGNPFSASYALMFDESTDADREAVDNDFYFHPLPYNLVQYKIVGEKLGSYKDGGKLVEYWERKDFRDFVQNDLMRRSDQICSAYLTRIIHGYSVGSAVGKTASSALGVLQTLAAPATFVANTIQVGSAGVTGLGGTEMLQYKIFSETNQRILQSRRVLRNAIRRAQSETALVYPISQALYDAERYHTQCNYATQWAAGTDVVTTENEVILVTPPAVVQSVAIKQPPPAVVVVTP